MEEPQPQITHDPLAAVRISEYRSFIFGRFFFIMGLRMMGTLVGWWVYSLTDDPFSIGLIGLSEVVPALSLALYAGHVMDISEKRRMMLRGMSLYICCALVLFFLSSTFALNELGNRGVVLGIYGIIFCTGIVRAFTGPIFNAVIASIVPRSYLHNAISWSQGTFLSASVMGHAIGGLLIAWIGMHFTLLVICFVILTSLLIMTRMKPKPPTNTNKEQKTWESVKEGLRFVYRTKEVLAALTLDLFAVLFGGAVAMVPVFARDILDVGARGFGILNAAADIGSITVVILLTLYPMKKNQGRKLLFAVGGFGLCIILFALSRWFLLSFLLLMLAG